MSTRPATPHDDRSDPVWRHSLREMAGMLAIFAFFAAWTVAGSATWGYGAGAQTEIILGAPAWIWWAVAAPWAAATLTTIAFATWCMRDDDLGESEPSASGEPAVEGSDD